MSKFFSRKWILALIFTVTGCAVFAFTAKLSGGEFISLALGILGIFTGGDAAINAIHKRAATDDGQDSGT